MFIFAHFLGHDERCRVRGRREIFPAQQEIYRRRPLAWRTSPRRYGGPTTLFAREAFSSSPGAADQRKLPTRPPQGHAPGATGNEGRGGAVEVRTKCRGPNEEDGRPPRGRRRCCGWLLFPKSAGAALFLSTSCCF